MKECDPAEPARLLFINFYGDHRPDTDCPQREEDWHPIIDRMEDRLRIDQKTEIMSRIHHLFLPVNPS